METLILTIDQHRQTAGGMGNASPSLEAEAQLFVKQHGQAILGLDLEMAKGILLRRQEAAGRMRAVMTHDVLPNFPRTTDSLDPFEREVLARARNPSRIDQRKSPKKTKPNNPLPEPSVIQGSAPLKEIAPSIPAHTVVAEERAPVEEMIGEVASVLTEESSEMLPVVSVMDIEVVGDDTVEPTLQQLSILEQHEDAEGISLAAQDDALFGGEYTESDLDEATGVGDYETDEAKSGSFEDIDFESLGIDPGGPTPGKPGSEEKVLMLAARYAAGIPLWNDNDGMFGSSDT